MNKYLKIVGVFALVGLAGCSKFQIEKPDHQIEEETREGLHKLIAANYAAVDKLIEVSSQPMSVKRPILVTSLVDNTQLKRSTPFGRISSEQMGSRLVAAGFMVREVKMGRAIKIRQGSGEFVLSRDTKELRRIQSAQAIIAGTYTPTPSGVYVNVKLLRASDAKVLAAHDYVLTMDDDISELVLPAGGRITSF